MCSLTWSLDPFVAVALAAVVVWVGRADVVVAALLVAEVASVDFTAALVAV